MNKRLSSILTIAAVAVLTTTLLSSTFTQTITGTALDAKTDLKADAGDIVAKMGGLVPRMDDAFAAVSCDNIEKGRNVVSFDVEGTTADLPIMGGGTYKAMTFNGQVPGPTLRVTQGDVIMVTLTVPKSSPTAHSIDLHASQISAIPNFGAVQPGESKTFCFVAESPGVFKYHCEGVNVAAMDQHVLSGMYGMTIVDPLNGYKPLLVQKTKVDNGQVKIDRKIYSADALEFTLQFNQLYLTDEGNYDQSAMFQHHSTQQTINGFAFGYVPNSDINKLVTGNPNKNLFVAQPWNSADLKQFQGTPLFVEAGQHVRFFVQNQGNEPVFFHVVGEQLDRVISGNRVQEAQTQTFLIGGSDDATVDLVFDDPGVYVAVNHDYAAIFQGTAAVIVAGNPFGLDVGNAKSYAEVLGNPSDAIPPMGKNSIAHPKVKLHCLCTDDAAQQIAKDLGI